jgi:hypothetical protein
MAFNAEQAKKRAASGMPAPAPPLMQQPPMPQAPMNMHKPPPPPPPSETRKSRLDQQQDNGSGSSDRKRKRKSRWGGGEDDKTFIPGMPTMLPSGLTKDQEEAYLCKSKRSRSKNLTHVDHVLASFKLCDVP